MKPLGRLAATTLLVCCFAPTPRAAAQFITEQQAEEILKELRAIRQLLERQQAALARPAQPAAAPTPLRARVKLSGGHVLGREDAPLTLVEFTDYQCPFCQRFNETTLPELKKKYIDTGKLRFVSRDLPLAFHANAARAAQAARCAAEQDKYWELREAIFGDVKRLAPADLEAHFKAVKGDVPAFQACVASDRFRGQIEADAADAASQSLTGTPSFVLGRSSGDVLDGVVIVGAQPAQAFEARIQDLLGQAAKAGGLTPGR